jgi:hypothetical protein
MAFDPFCSDDCFSRRSAASIPNRVRWRDRGGLGLEFGTSACIASREVEFIPSPTTLLPFPVLTSEAISSPPSEICPCSWLSAVGWALGLAMASKACDPAPPRTGPSSNVLTASCVSAEVDMLRFDKRPRVDRVAIGRALSEEADLDAGIDVCAVRPSPN